MKNGLQQACREESTPELDFKLVYPVKDKLLMEGWANYTYVEGDVLGLVASWAIRGSDDRLNKLESLSATLPSPDNALMECSIMTSPPLFSLDARLMKLSSRPIPRSDTRLMLRSIFSAKLDSDARRIRRCASMIVFAASDMRLLSLLTSGPSMASKSVFGTRDRCRPMMPPEVEQQRRIRGH